MAYLLQWKKDREQALLSLDAGKITAYMRKYGERIPADPDIFWLGVHMARANLRSLPQAEQQRSVEWLGQHGYVLDKTLPAGWRYVGLEVPANELPIDEEVLKDK